MPITVKHDPEAMDALVALALAAGAAQRQVPQLPAVHIPSIGGISQPSGGGGGGRTRSGGGGPTLGQVTQYSLTPEEQVDLQAKLAAETMERTMPLELERAREQAKIEAEQWEYKFSAQQRQRIARNNNAKEQLRRNPAFNPQEAEIGCKLLDLDTMGINPGMMPKTGPTFPEGQSIGQSWMDEHGNLKTRNKDGEDITQVKYSDSRQAYEDKKQEARELKQMELEARRQEKLLEMRQNIAETYGPENVDRFMQGIIPPQLTQPQPPTQAELEAELRRRVGAPPEQELAQRLQQEVKGRLQGQQYITGREAPRELIPWARSLEVHPTKTEKGLPQWVALSQAFMREVRRRRDKGIRISPEMFPAIEQAQAILQQYDATR